jgi:nickel transport protein
MSRAPLLALIGVAGLALAPGAARAHGIESSLDRLGGLSDRIDFTRTASGNRTASGSPTASGSRAPATQLQLESRFSSGLPASEAAVRLVPPDGGTPIELGRTDTRGQLTFALPARAGSDWELQVDAGPGHRDYLELPGADQTPGAPQARTFLPRAAMRTSRWHVLSPLVVIGLIGGIGGLRRWRRRL